MYVMRVWRVWGFVWVQVVKDGKVVNAGGKSHKKVPNGMGKRNSSIHLEEYYPSNVENAS
jgi:hypothetical protein